MMKAITVREFGRLTTEHVEVPSLDRAQVSVSAFDWLCQLSKAFGASGASLVQVEDRRWLKLDNYVGVIETPCGTRVEILPKLADDEADSARSRKLLRRMICAAMDLPVREVSQTELQTFDAPLSEWVMGHFLAALNHLIKRGVRSDYIRVEAAELYLRGRLDLGRQLRQPVGRGHIFQIHHDIFVPERPENRLLKKALDRVARLAQTPANWRLAQELRILLHEIPASSDVEADFRAWRTDRLMAHYTPVRPWCELILYRMMPRSLVGEWHGISLLFPMEKLFERFVAGWLRRNLASEVTLRAPAASKYLCIHDGDRMFRLEPDLLVEHKDERWVLDTKWKRLDALDRTNKYGLSQADLYQLFAYGMKYLDAGAGDVTLIYPSSPKFQISLPPFDFGNGLNLRVLPFDLDNEVLIDFEQIGLPLASEAIDGARSGRMDQSTRYTTRYANLH